MLAKPIESRLFEFEVKSYANRTKKAKPRVNNIGARVPRGSGTTGVLFWFHDEITIPRGNNDKAGAWHPLPEACYLGCNTA